MKPNNMKTIFDFSGNIIRQKVIAQLAIERDFIKRIFIVIGADRNWIGVKKNDRNNI